MCRDRQAYLTDIRDGTPSLVPGQNNITKNLVMPDPCLLLFGCLLFCLSGSVPVEPQLFNSYSSTWPLDHDDGSCYYTDTENFMI